MSETAEREKAEMRKRIDKIFAEIDTNGNGVVEKTELL